MGVGETGGVVEDIGDQLVDGVLGNVVAGENDCADGDGDGVRIKTVNILADGDLGVVRGRGKQLVDVLIIERDKIDVLGRRKVSDCRCRSTRNDEGRVDLAVFQGIRAVAERLIRRVDVRLRQAVSAEHVHGVEIHAGTGRADGDVFALEIVNRLDLRIGRDDLHLLGVERGDRGEAADSAGVGKQVRAVVGVGHHVGLAEGQLRVAVFQLKNIRLGAVADQTDNVNARVVRRVLGNDGAEGVVRAGFAAGDEAQLGTGGCCRRFSVGSRCIGCVRSRIGRRLRGSRGRSGTRGHAQNEDSREKQCKNLFHIYSLLN